MPYCKQLAVHYNVKQTLTYILNPDKTDERILTASINCMTEPEFAYTQEEQEKAADIMFDNLVASPTHYDNMTFRSFTKVGIRTNVANTGDGTRLTTAYLFSN